MSALGTAEIYRTESGSIYELRGNELRCTGGSNPTLEDWTPVESVNRLPAIAAGRLGGGEILEIRLTDGKRIFTSRLVPLLS